MESTELEESMNSQELLQVSSDLELPAMMKRVQDVQTLAASQERAMQEQQQALQGLEQEQELLAARLARLASPGDGDGESKADDSAKRDAEYQQKLADQKILCSPKTNRSCDSWHGFGSWGCDMYGKATCDRGECACDPDVCADGYGMCNSKDKARLLPDTYTIEVHKYLGKFIHMQKDDDALDFSEGDPGEKGHWRIIVNNDDDTIMMYTTRWGPDYFMSVEDLGRRGPEDSWSKFNSPREASFVAYKGTAKRGGEVVYLKDLRSGLWLSVVKKLGGNAIQGVEEFPSKSGAFIFHPPLKDVQLQDASSRCVLPLLPFLLFLGRLFVYDYDLT